MGGRLTGDICIKSVNIQQDPAYFLAFCFASAYRFTFSRSVCKWDNITDIAENITSVCLIRVCLSIIHKNMTHTEWMDKNKTSDLAEIRTRKWISLASTIVYTITLRATEIATRFLCIYWTANQS